MLALIAGRPEVDKFATLAPTLVIVCIVGCLFARNLKIVLTR
jgi:hypothetical protein